MRKILFRGKRIGSGEWIEGYVFPQVIDGGYAPLCITTEPICANDYSEILGDWAIVDSSTIGQYTGLTDKNGTKVFEGDIISCGYLCDFFVEYSEEDAEYWANFGDSIGSLHTYFDPKRATVIGNIYDNPELLEVSE